jgi:hypothetical protein
VQLHVLGVGERWSAARCHLETSIGGQASGAGTAFVIPALQRALTLLDALRWIRFGSGMTSSRPNRGSGVCDRVSDRRASDPGERSQPMCLQALRIDDLAARDAMHKQRVGDQRAVATLRHGFGASGRRGRSASTRSG